MTDHGRMLDMGEYCLFFERNLALLGFSRRYGTFTVARDRMSRSKLCDSRTVGRPSGGIVTISMAAILYSVL